MAAMGTARRHAVRTSRFLPVIVISGATLITITAMLVVSWLLTHPEQAATLPAGAPSIPVVLMAATALIAVGIGVVALEALSALPQLRPVGDVIPGGQDDIVDLHITVLIPAHDEEATLPRAFDSLESQTLAPDRVIVIADRCGDCTADIARVRGAFVMETFGNRGRKAGALNQALSRIVPTGRSHDVIIIMDADTELSPRFIETASASMRRDGTLAAVGGVFAGENTPGMLALLQRNEFTRYSGQIAARRGRVSVLTGTATAFRVGALADVASHRDGRLPGTRGQVYDETAITEDNELTLALKSMGAHILSPRNCDVTTEVMPTLPALWTQRLRWQRGALENIGAYGIRTATARYWLQQWGIAYGTVALTSSLVLLVVAPVVAGQWYWFPFWSLVAIAFAVERTLTVWRSGWKARFLAVVLIPEIAYSIFLQACFVRAIFGLPRARGTRWGHVRREAAEAPA